MSRTKVSKNNPRILNNTELKPLIVSALIRKSWHELKKSVNKRCLPRRGRICFSCKGKEIVLLELVVECKFCTNLVGINPQFLQTATIVLKFACWTVLLLVAMSSITANLTAFFRTSSWRRRYWILVSALPIYLDRKTFSVSKYIVLFRIRKWYWHTKEYCVLQFVETESRTYFCNRPVLGARSNISWVCLLRPGQF